MTVANDALASRRAVEARLQGGRADVAGIAVQAFLLLSLIVTLGVLVGAAEPLSQFMVGFFQILPINVGSISRDVTMLVVGSGLGLGVVGAWLSVRTYLIR